MKTMPDILDETTPVIFSTVVSTVISTIVLSIVLSIPAFLLKMYYYSIELITGLYILLLVIVSYIFFFKKQMISTYIKRIRFIIVIILVLIPTIFFINYNPSHIISDLHIKIINTKSSEINLSNEGEFHIVTVKGARNEKVANEIAFTIDDPGKVELKTSNNSHPYSLRIPPNEELMVNAQIIKPERYLDFYQKDYYIYFTLYQTDNKELDTQGGLHFDKDTISNEYMPYKI